MLTVGTKDLTKIVGRMSLSSAVHGGADCLTFSYPLAAAGLLENGEAVVLTDGGRGVFYGFLFTVSTDGQQVDCTAYDQLRYWKGQGVVQRDNAPIGGFLERVAARVGERIRLGEIQGGGEMLPARLFDGVSYLDMLYQSIEELREQGGEQLVLRDEFGALALRPASQLRLGLTVGDGSLATGLDYSRSIDSDTYNFVQVRSGAGGASYAAQDEKTIRSWGKLMLYKAGGRENGAQLQALAGQLLRQKNREVQKLSLSCRGDWQVRGGNGVRVLLKGLGLDRWMLVEKASHSLNSSGHTMKLDLRMEAWDGWN